MRRLILGLLALFVAAPAAAQSEIYAELDGWLITKIGEDACQAGHLYDEKLLFSVIVSKTRRGLISVSNDAWKDLGTRYDVAISLDGWRSTQTVAGDGMVTPRGFRTVRSWIEAPVNLALLQSGRLGVRIAPLELDLDASMPADVLGKLNACVDGKPA